MNARKRATWLVIGVSGFLTGCGLIPANPEVELAYSVMYSQFLADAARYNRELNLGDLVVKSADLPSDTVGECSSPKTILIDRAYWDASDRYRQEELFYHEMGHCVLGQDHRPNSIMAEYGIMEWAFVRDHEDYLAELFTHEGA